MPRIACLALVMTIPAAAPAAPVDVFLELVVTEGVDLEDGSDAAGRRFPVGVRYDTEDLVPASGGLFEVGGARPGGFGEVSIEFPFFFDESPGEFLSNGPFGSPRAVVDRTGALVDLEFGAYRELDIAVDGGSILNFLVIGVSDGTFGYTNRVNETGLPEDLITRGGGGFVAGLPTPVPLPAGAPLLVAGLGALALVRSAARRAPPSSGRPGK